MKGAAKVLEAGLLEAADHDAEGFVEGHASGEEVAKLLCEEEAG